MNESVTFRYTDLEIRGYLPGGWTLRAPADTAAWNPRKKTWTVRIHDPAEVDWDLVVTAKQVDKLGRLEALRQAIERVYRNGLG